MQVICELRGFLEEDNKKTPFYLRISGPEASSGGEDYYCRVHAPQLFISDKDIFGADEEQARELAGQFAKSLLEGRRLTDNAGQSIDMSQLKI